MPTRTRRELLGESMNQPDSPGWLRNDRKDPLGSTGLRRDELKGKRELLQHFLASLAYRLQKALRDAPRDFSEFRVSPDVRNPHELVRHMTSVLGYARTFFIGGEYRATELPTLEQEVARFHEVLGSLSEHFATGDFSRMSPKRYLQGPLSDAMTHAGQLAMLRRLSDAPVPPENFIMADIQADNVSEHQPDPAAPDDKWHTPATRTSNTPP
jgi:hypothetical protein